MGAAGVTYGTQTGGGSSCNQAPAQTQTTGNETVIPLQREQMQVGKQEVSNSAVRVRKTVKTQTVTQPVTIRQETVTVDRVPAGQNPAPPNTAPGTALNQPFQGGEITIPLREEQPMVQTKVVPSGSVVIHKQETSRPINVQGQVRSEDVVTEQVGNPQNQQGGQGAPPPTAGQSSGAGSSGTITELDQLSSPSNASALAGRQVGIANAKVDKVISPQLLTILAPDGTPIYVRATQPFSGISAGQTVNLNGTVRQTPADMSHLGWDSTSAQAMQGQQIFIEVQSIAPPGQ